MSDGDALFLLPSATRRDPAVDTWFAHVTDPFRLIAQVWFERIRTCGPDVTDLIHDGRPTACVSAAAFAYVGAYSAHASIGFYHGATLPDPAGLLEGSGKRMRHVKLRPGVDHDDTAIEALVAAAYADTRRRVSAT